MKKISLCAMFVMAVISGCVFSMNDDYDKNITIGGSDGEFSVSGIIINSSGVGVSELNVELIGTNVVNTTTNLDGSFLFENLGPGTYIVAPPANNYAPMPISISNADVSIGTIRRGGHGAHQNYNYTCTLCH